jgi:type IV secretory pathway TraG/TraD family ATPase VirD4
LAIQDIGQIKKLYGDDLAQTIVNGCGSHYTFSVSDGDTARFLSDKIGQVEYLERHKSITRGGGKGAGVSRSESAQSKTEPLYLPADIMGMKDLNFLLKISNYPICRTSIDYHKWPTFEPALLEKPDFDLDNLEQFAPVVPSMQPQVAAKPASWPVDREHFGALHAVEEVDEAKPHLF